MTDYFLSAFMCDWFGGAGCSCLTKLFEAQTAKGSAKDIDPAALGNIPVSHITGIHGFKFCF